MEKNYFKFFELSTEEEPLYIYETYENNPDDRNNHEIPTTREFFTQEEAQRSYLSLLFLDGKCSYTTEYYTIQGEWVEDYMKELSPHEFFEKVGPYLKDDETFEKKRREVENSMQFKANLTTYRMVKKQLTEMPKDKQDEAAKIILKRYIKES